MARHNKRLAAHTPKNLNTELWCSRSFWKGFVQGFSCYALVLGPRPHSFEFDVRHFDSVNEAWQSVGRAMRDSFEEFENLEKTKEKAAANRAEDASIRSDQPNAST